LGTVGCCNHSDLGLNHLKHRQRLDLFQLWSKRMEKILMDEAFFSG